MTPARNNASPPTLAEDRGGRESIIRDLYALVAFYVANPEFPLPTGIQVHCKAPLEEIVKIAAERDRRVYGEQPQTDFGIEGTARPITIIVGLPREDRPL